MTKSDRHFISLISMALLTAMLSIGAFVDNERSMAFIFVLFSFITWGISTLVPNND